MSALTFSAIFSRDGLVLRVRERPLYFELTLPDNGQLPSGERCEQFTTRKEAVDAALCILDNYS